MPRKRAFTIPEMLTVVAIIVVIISMLFPSFQRIKEISRRSICANNLHQLHLGYYNYAVDSSRHLPVTGHSGGTANEGYWVETKLANNLVRNYLGGSFEVYYCPSALLRGFANYPSLAAEPTALWWWETWQIQASYFAYRVTGYGSACHLNPAMPNDLRIRRTTDNPSLALIYDANDRGPNGTIIPGWSWRLSHDDGRIGPEGANRVQLAGDVQWVMYADMKGRWFVDGVWQIWW